MRLDLRRASLIKLGKMPVIAKDGFTEQDGNILMRQLQEFA
jgi:hypothetical protein